MSEIFVSHSSRDASAVREIIARLRDEGYLSLFLDFDPNDGILAGRSWEQEIYRMLRQSRALVAVCSANWLDSKWCFAELTQARALGKAIFLVKIDACELPAFTSSVQAIGFHKDAEAGYRALLRGLKEAGLDPVDESAALSKGRAPYPGFDAFPEGDAAVYFGRETEIQETLESLRTLQEFGSSPSAPRMVLVLGASGAGKSSFVRAGLIPRLKRDPARWFVLPVIRPGGKPFDALVSSLESSAARADADEGSHPASGTARQRQWVRHPLRGLQTVFSISSV